MLESSNKILLGRKQRLLFSKVRGSNRRGNVSNGGVGRDCVPKFQLAHSVLDPAFRNLVQQLVLAMVDKICHNVIRNGDSKFVVPEGCLQPNRTQLH